jgi:hypothetical protein
MLLVNRSVWGRFAAGIAFAAVAGLSNSHSQDIDFRGDGTNGGVILQGKNINPNSYDHIGVLGHSAPAPHYGIGVRGVGGWRGVEGISTVSGAGARIGLYGEASGATSGNYGVYGVAYGTGAVAGYFSGNLQYTGTLSKVSDIKFKKNISSVKNCMGRLSQLSAKEYEYRTHEYAKMNLPEKKEIGFIAQDVETVFPELVEVSMMPEAGNAKSDGTGSKETYKSVNYTGLIPILVGALQEQQKEIDALKRKLGEK